MRRHVLVLPLLLLAVVAACTDRVPVAPAASRALAPPLLASSRAGARRITVMSRNLYVGADVDAAIGALASPDPSDDVPALLEGVATLRNTDFPARAEALADEIARARPHVVGLQEVEVLHVDLAPLGIPALIDLDFLAILQAALRARGLNYALAGEVTDLVATPVPFINLTDHDAILVDADRVSVAPGVTAQTFTLNVGVVAPGVELKRGWVRIDATIEGMPVTIASTHLESGSSRELAALRAAQAAELVQSLGAGTRAILLGDLNDEPGSAMYGVVAGAGFTDTWRALRPGVRGFTCCERADLSNSVAVLDQRIDYVWTRGIAGPNGRTLGQVRLVGDRPGDRVEGPSYKIWPSDHAGLVASLLLPAAVLP